ncbi:ABC transporter permease [Enterococcus asini]|uniref:ABC transporter permease n=1 Tax=Enterococcus asini TaxID=57732 RepID=UPI000E4C2DB5|nr:ABC transporter permease [Enterococcus asini]MCD5029696.1 ABC transporter permease [Enterococcus asini]MDT2784288.1 ABC transporter permease [Enterococcus asini]RGW12334.1 ABC transporter permease [Enterococcus asini]
MEKKHIKSPLTNSFFRYCLVRFLFVIPTVLILVTVVFFLTRLTGDPITVALSGKLPPAEIAARVHQAGYDRPVIVQYIEYLGNLLQGDLGNSTSMSMPVTEILKQYGAATFELAILATIVALVVGIPLGKLAARYRDRWPDVVIRLFSIVCYATPVFFLGLVLKLIFSVYIPILPSSGRVSAFYEAQLQSVAHPTGFNLIDALQTGDGAIIVDVLQHAILPALALGLLTAATFIRLIRTNLISTLSTDYVFAARSKGVTEKRIVNKHAWKPALMPIITVMGMNIAMMLAGAILTETTFEWKGLGYQLSQVIKARDFNAVQGIVILIAVIVSLTNFIVDVAAAAIDPRIRQKEESK